MIGRLIERKREGKSLTRTEWGSLISDYTSGAIPDYQMAALLMASFLNGLNSEELLALTEAMINSGDKLAFAEGVIAIDKHSTGGVGDKVSIVLAPLVACCGVPVPMMSGRGLGHTTGTLDKLEAIPGFRTGLTLNEARRQVEEIGCAMFGQTEEIAPADRKLYALRDATATVESIPLIAASIMSKKLCEGIAGLVLDVKHGSGAFLRDQERATELARAMIELGEDRGCRTVALLTAMDRPLGKACGNALETREAIEALSGGGPEDLIEVTIALGVEMLILGRVCETPDQARELLVRSLADGSALEKLSEIVGAQGGDARAVENPSLLPKAQLVRDFESPSGGFVARIEPREIGHAIVAMGGGRSKVDDSIDYGAGFVFNVAPGAEVAEGVVLASVHASNEENIELGLQALKNSISISESPPAPLSPLVSHRADTSGVVSL